MILYGSLGYAYVFWTFLIFFSIQVRMKGDIHRYMIRLYIQTGNIHSYMIKLYIQISMWPEHMKYMSVLFAILFCRDEAG